jgi:hypothetical protein
LLRLRKFSVMVFPSRMLVFSCSMDIIIDLVSTAGLLDPQRGSTGQWKEQHIRGLSLGSNRQTTDVNPALALATVQLSLTTPQFLHL